MKKVILTQPFWFGFLLTIISVFSVNTSGFSQNQVIDSLTKIISSYKTLQKTDTTYARLEHDLATEFNTVQNNDAAIKHETIALNYSGDNASFLFMTHNSLGRYYLNDENFIKSLTEFQNALEQAILLKDNNMIGIVHYNLSTHYDRTENDVLAYEHLRKAYDLMIETGDTVKTVYLLNSLGGFEVANEKFDQAHQRYKKALELSIAYGDSTLISNSYNNSANYYLNTNDTLNALVYLKKSYAIDKINGTAENLAIVTLNISSMYYLIDELDSSLVYINLSKENANNTGRFTLLIPIYNVMFNLYNELGKYDSLLPVFEDYQDASDSLLNSVNLKKYSEAQSEIELISTQRENEILQINEESSKQRFIYLAIVTFLLLLILIGALIMNKRFKTQKELAESLHQQIKKQQLELLSQNSVLENNAHYKDRIMSLLAHDLRTPFASINSLNHLIKSTGELTEKQTTFLQTSNKVVTGGLDLISDILHIYKLENVSDYEFETLNISQLLSYSAEKIQPISIVKSQNIILDYEDNIEFSINREMLQSAVDNLLSNASKYSDPGKEITIKMRKTDQSLTIFIIDQGYGFSSAEQKIIFDRFNKFTRKTLSNESSTGLGLFLVKGFVEKLGGTISIDSKPNQGSIFTLVFNQTDNS